MYGVGFAAVLVGGCPLRQLVIASTGSNDAVFTVIGMFVGSALAHNFLLAATPAANKTATNLAVIGGPGPNGKIAVIVSIILLFIIAMWGLRKEKLAK